MSKPQILLLDFTCWCLITVLPYGRCEATVYIRGKKEKVYKVYAHCWTSSSGVAEEWARSIEPTITCVKVASYER